MELNLATDPASLSPLAMFLQADIVVMAVMIGLALASLWTWSIIFGFLFRLGGVNKSIVRFERDFDRAQDIDLLYRQRADGETAIERVFAAGVEEWRKSTAGHRIDRDGTRERLATAMAGRVAFEVEKLSERLNWLATIGSVAPFVGLFGTVWGIMRSFTAIAAKQNTALAVVAPGIAEALFATAIGLFAAIPAVIAYNRFGHRVNGVEARLMRFADKFHLQLSRQLEG